MDLNKVTDKVTQDIYIMYGSDTGYLFGIPPEQQDVVRAIVKTVLMHKGVVIDELAVLEP